MPPDLFFFSFSAGVQRVMRLTNVDIGRSFYLLNGGNLSLEAFRIFVVVSCCCLDVIISGGASAGARLKQMSEKIK